MSPRRKHQLVSYPHNNHTHLHQYILGLDISVGDGWLALAAEYLSVEVEEAVDGGEGDSDEARVVEGMGGEVVVQGAARVVVGDEPELCA